MTTPAQVRAPGPELARPPNLVLYSVARSTCPIQASSTRRSQPLPLAMPYSWTWSMATLRTTCSPEVVYTRIAGDR